MAVNEAPELTAVAVDPTLILLTVEEAARRLGIGRTTCFRLVSTGELESVTVGRLRRVPADALSTYVATLRRATLAA
ncbi:excisionase family DNA-binding protein [Streptomyces triticagri]|uniref:excisionase family DNA-binding protein n=1 Tax=Streptomyces triticagri TaxID=2293568 RepID=UPI00389A83AB